MQSINSIKQAWDNKSLWVFLGCLFAITPLYVPSTLDYLGKGFLLILLICSCQLIKRKKGMLNPNEKLAIYGALAYAFIFIISFFTLSAINPSETWRMESAGFVLVVTFYYWLAVKLHQKHYFIDYVAISSFFAAILLLFLEASDITDFSTYRYSQLKGGSRGLAAIGFITPITAVLFAVLSIQRKSRLYFILFIFMVILSGLNKSRTSLAILSMPLLASLFYCLFSLKKINIKKQLMIISITLLSLATVSFIAKDRIYQGVTDIKRITQGKYDGSLGLRFSMLDIGIQLGKKSPILGTGAGKYNEELTKIVGQSTYSKESKQAFLGFSHLHNQYIMTWILSGIIGLLSLLFFLFFPIFISFKQYRATENKTPYNALPLILGGSVFIGIGISMMFGAIFTYTYTTIFYCFFMYAFVSSISQKIEIYD